MVTIVLKMGLGFRWMGRAVSRLVFALAVAAGAQASGGLETQLLQGLCAKYADPCADETPNAPGRTRLIEQVALSLGQRLGSAGPSAVPAEDIAALALLLARQGAADSQTNAVDTSRNERGSQPRPDQPTPQLSSTSPPQQTGQGDQAGSSSTASGAEEDQRFADIGKGQEGFRQGVERLAELPVTERMVITGDITSGLQAATVSDRADLTSTFGRVRVNFVTRAVPASADGRFSEGYFFAQMRAAGGPFDASTVGGPSLFSPLNDVATDRSRYNEGTSRGNLYLAKAFYQQEMRLAGGDVVGRVGIINLADFFDTSEFANNEARQFLSSALVNSAAYKSGISAPGFMGSYRRKVDRDWLQGMVFRSGYGISRTERAFTSPIWAAETELETVLRGYEGKYRFGGTLGNVADVGGIRGIHLGFDQWISPNLGVYGRYALSNSSPGSFALGPARKSYSGGVQWRFVNEQDRVSAWAVGFSRALGIQTDEPLASERVIETYYRWQLSENFALTPDFQVVFGAGGNKTRGTHVVTGMRMNFGF